MKSYTPKVLHPLCGRPILGYVLDLVDSLRPEKAVAVLGYQRQDICRLIKPGVKIAIQKKLLGTADALKAAMPLLKNFKGTVLVLYGDTPLLEKETVKKLLEHHAASQADATLLTARAEKPAGYGRVLRDKYAGICAVIEDKDADDFQKEIREVNTGIICFKKDKLAGALSRVRPDNRKKEYYLTDIIKIIYNKGGLIEGVKLSDINQAMGINSRLDLARANSLMQQKINRRLMLDGITIVSPATTFISYGSKIGRDTVIYPFTVIERDVKIGKHCSLGPFVHLREGTRVEDNTLIGNFVETVRSRISADTLIKHFSYLGDSRIGRRVNIGAGTVTANFNGKKKNPTVVEDGAFIGSDTVLVAPVRVGRRARTGAGSVVTRNKNVAAGTTVAGVPAKLFKR